MQSGFQRPPAPGERPEPSRPTGLNAQGSEEARGYPDRPAITSICLESLDGALALVRADGGEIALLDASEPVLVSRARRMRPPHLGRAGYGTPSRPSQPRRIDSVPDDPMALIDDQTTQLLPSAQIARVYRPGQGLLGTVWKRREPLRPETTSEEARQALLLEPDAPHHLAVPIFLPERLDRIGGRGAVIGALRVFNRDAMWSYTTNDVRLLELHADRLSRALALLDSPALAVRQDDLATILRELNGVSPTADAIFARALDIILRENLALSVCALLRAGEGDDLTVALAHRRGARRQGERLTTTEAPAVIRRALLGEIARDPSPQLAAYATLCARLGWDADAPGQSVFAAPIPGSSRTMGALLVMAPQSAALTSDLTARVEAVALAVSVYLENARLVENAHHSVSQFNELNMRLSALNNAVLTLNSSLDEAATLQSLANQASLVASAAVCAVLVRDETAKTLQCRAVFSNDNPRYNTLLGATIPLSWRKIGERLETSLYIEEDLTEISGDLTGEATASMRAVGARTILATPIARQGEQLGALAVFMTGQSGQSTHDMTTKISLLSSLASQAAVAISNARLYQELQQAYERQKELDRLKDDFILTVSHEFRTPLTAIEGYVTLISRHGQKLDQDKLQTFAGEIHQATVQLAGMISMLADASRMSDQVLRVSTKPVNLAEAAREAINRQPPEEKKRIQTRIDESFWAQADDERLPLVFSNLISNALKYSGPDKQCRVITRRAARGDLAAARRRRAQEDGAPEEWMVITVEDEGPGISTDDQARLFQKFVRLQHSLTTSVRGTGLGLWICRQYVEAMGGEIWVDSRPGQGARFSFMLPRAEAPAEQP